MTHLYVDGLSTTGDLNASRPIDIASVKDAIGFEWVEADMSITDNTVTYTVKCDRFKITAIIADGSVTYKVYTDDIYRVIEQKLKKGKVITNDRTM